MDARLKLALDAVPKGVRYADIRLVEWEREDIYIKDGKVETVTRTLDSGIGVRCISRGAWGFAATSDSSKDAIGAAVHSAVDVARASSIAKIKDVELSDKEAASGVYAVEVKKDPFKVSVDEKINYLLQCDKQLRAVKGVSISECWIQSWLERKCYADTEGSDTEQNFTGIQCGVRASALNDNDLQARTYPSFRGQGAHGGYELVEELGLLGHCERVGEEAVMLLNAPECPKETTDLVFTPAVLGIFIHETVGHPTELDRVFGTEANYAGTSHLVPEKLNTFRFGSDLVTLVADATVPHGLGSFWYDDEGVPAQRTELVKDGIFVGYLTSRETAKVLNQRSSGTMRAQRWCHIPLIRMTNINLEPRQGTFDDVMSTTDGYLFDGFKSCSIDDRRLNFNLAADIAWRVKNGKKLHVIKNPVVSGISYEFWRNVDFVGGKESWALYGLLNCGKGRPGQIMKVGHGAPPIRIRNVTLGV
ncbi:MAG: TldD/PmbA family protein [candidate division WOR-3 bacterium]|nr:MAG: TldD/PmbA family protein [candidate division WOR-3 bacterium]